MEKNRVCVFAPRGGEREIVELCPDGKVLNLWPREESYAYHVYKPGNPGDGGKISTVPDKYTEDISLAKREGRIIEATFSEVNGKKRVKIEIFSKDASNAKIKDQADSFAKRLHKKYSPQKSLVCKIFLNTQHGLHVGDSVFLADKPAEYYAASAVKDRMVLDFHDINGRDIGKLHFYVGVQEKILRAKYSGYVLDIKVLSVKNQDQYVTEILGHIEATIEIKFIKRC